MLTLKSTEEILIPFQVIFVDPFLDILLHSRLLSFQLIICWCSCYRLKKTICWIENWTCYPSLSPSANAAHSYQKLMTLWIWIVQVAPYNQVTWNIYVHMTHPSPMQHINMMNRCLFMHMYTHIPLAFVYIMDILLWGN